MEQIQPRRVGRRQIQRGDPDRIQREDDREPARGPGEAAPPGGGVGQRDGAAERHHVRPAAARVDDDALVGGHAVPGHQGRLEFDDRADDVLFDPRETEQTEERDVPGERLEQKALDVRRYEIGWNG